MVEADCNMAQAFEFPTVSRTTRPLCPKGRSSRSFPRGFPDPFPGSPFRPGTTLSCPIGSVNMGLWPARRKRAFQPADPRLGDPAQG
jgi:hypothetical protein